MRGSSPRMTQQDFGQVEQMQVAGLNVSELLELAGLLVVVGALAAGFWYFAYGKGKGI